MNHARAGLVREFVVAEPGCLPPGVTAGRGNGARGGLGESDLAPQMGGELRHAVRPHRRQRRIEPEREHFPHFLDCTSLQHGGEPGGDRLAQRRPGRIEDDRGETPCDRRPSRSVGQPSGEPATGAAPDFPRPR